MVLPTTYTVDLIKPSNIFSAAIQDIPEYKEYGEIKDDNMNECTGVINKVIEKIAHENIVVFTDGSVYNGLVGCRACSAVLYPVKSDVEDPCVMSVSSRPDG